MSGRKTNRDPELDVELGEQVGAAPRKRTGAAMVAVRLSADLLERVDAYARANGLTLSDVLRQGVERVLARGDEGGPFAVSGTIVITGAGQIQALASSGQGVSHERTGSDRPELTLAG